MKTTHICDPEQRDRAYTFTQKTKYVWVQNPESSDEKIHITNDLEYVHRLMSTGDKLYRLGQEVKLKPTLEVISEPVYRTAGSLEEGVHSGRTIY